MYSFSATISRNMQCLKFGTGRPESWFLNSRKFTVIDHFLFQCHTFFIFRLKGLGCPIKIETPRKEYLTL